MNKKPLSHLTGKLAVAIWLTTLGAAHSQIAAEAWVQRYGNQVGGWDSAGKLVTDAAGNVIVAGITAAGNNSTDFLIVKYSGMGTPLWTNRYDGPGNNFDEPADLAVDEKGNVSVTGYSEAATGGRDYVTLAYSSAGVPLWTNRYNGTANDHDAARSIGVDRDGNVFVTGSSPGAGSETDYLTIKYSSAGVPVWTNRYNGPGNSADDAFALAVDDGGNVFVTGGSSGNGVTDYITIKYSSAGIPLWTNRYGGPTFNIAIALGLDNHGNVFVTGRSYNGSDDDYLTIKYLSTGEAMWTNRYTVSGYGYDQVVAIAVDGGGNVVVTGNSGDDYVTIEYSSTGVPLWTNRFDGPANSSDGPRAVAVDGSGNVVVTGSSQGLGSFDYATIKYSATGVPLWTNRYNGPANDQDNAGGIAVDNLGNVFVTGSATVDFIDGTDCVTIKYTGAGIPLWTNRYGGLKNGGDQATALAVSGNSNVVVTGISGGPGTATDYATVAYSGTGVPLWTNRYNGPFNRYDEPVGVAVDGSGNVVVTGTSQGVGSFDYATIKYSAAGVPLWTNRYDSTGNDYAHAVAVNSGGDVFVTGFNGGYATIKYSMAGVPLWTNLYDLRGIGNDKALAMVVDMSGNVIVTGASDGDSSYYDYATIKYSPTGATLWTKRYNGPGNDYDEASAVAVDTSGNVFVTGRSSDSSFYYNYATIKYSASGTELWVRRYSGDPFGSDHATAMAVDGNGNLFVTGWGSYGYSTVAYSSAGVPLWTNRSQGSDHAAIAVGGGNVFVTGGDRTVAYSGAGVPLWTNYFHGVSSALGYSAAVAADSSGNVFVTGMSASDYATIKYSVAALQLIPLNYQLIGNQLVLSWTNAAFGLQSAPVPTGNFTNISAANSPFTNPLSGGQRYFRLKAN